MNKREIMGFVWDYYKGPIIVGLVLIIFVVSLVRHYMNYQKPIVQIALLNCNTARMEEEGEPDFTDFMEQYGYNTKREKVTLLTNFTVDLKSNSTTDMYQFQSLVALITAGGIDLLVANEEAYEFMVECNSVDSLEEHISEELIKKYEEEIVYLPNPDTGRIYPAGIRIPENDFMTENRFYNSDCIIGFGNGSTKDEAAERMLWYILGEE